MDYSHLQHIALEVCQQADKFNIPYKVYWYSPDSRKANPKTKIGHYVQPEPYRVCRRVNILRDYPDDKTKLYPRN